MKFGKPQSLLKLTGSTKLNANKELYWTLTKVAIAYTGYYGAWVYFVYKHGLPGRLPPDQMPTKHRPLSGVSQDWQAFCRFVRDDFAPYQEDYEFVRDGVRNTASKLMQLTVDCIQKGGKVSGSR